MTPLKLTETELRAMREREHDTVTLVRFPDDSGFAMDIGVPKHWKRVHFTATYKIDRLRMSAESWWRMRRPVSWSEAQHMENPTVNCTTDAERELALAIAVLSPAAPPAKG
jgi:hypothetical protein